MKLVIVQFPDSVEATQIPKGTPVVVVGTVAGVDVTLEDGVLMSHVEILDPPPQTVVEHTHNVVAAGPAQVTGVSGPPL